MKIDIVTLFPKQISDFLNYSIVKRAIDQKKMEVKIHDLRKWAVDARGSVDARPYGGGQGMILRCEPVVAAIRELRGNSKFEIRNSKQIQNNKKQGNTETRKNEGDAEKVVSNGAIEQLNNELVVMFDARGKVYSQQTAFEFSKLDHLILLCGHYEGFDERILNYVDMTISIGEYVLTGGEIPALVVVDSVVRLLPGVLKPGVVENESFSKKNLKFKIRNLKNEKEYPQYTRPEEFESRKVPEVLLSGNHKEIEKWRKR